MSFNRYAYADNNPYGFVDPDGRQSVESDDNQTRAEQFEELELIDPSAGTANVAAQADSAIASAGNMAETGFSMVAGGAAIGFGGKLINYFKELFGRVKGLIGGAKSIRSFDSIQDARGATFEAVENLLIGSISDRGG